ncbi:MAG: AAA family ATPase [Desulfobacteraceae bacterium]|jgi:DNA helicase-2/ATP-dependent DNA helicase PcrA|nr:MAG: AAA family ATPase [Desulfobacteraceae bacterium]
MRFLADLHIHSRYSRATARDLTPENLSLWAKKKGLAVIGTGDFTHPGWVSELKEKLVEKEVGIYQLTPSFEAAFKNLIPHASEKPTRFILTGEISCIYKKDGRTRKIHHLLLMPSFESLDRFNRSLTRIGNLASDGRPILGLDSRDLLELALEAEESSLLIPAHIWTPWFSLFGSKSGFETLEECFGDLTSHVKALETGLSSDPPMNRLLSCLDHLNLISNSDAHSTSKLGREANIFDTEISYSAITRAIKTGEGLEGTVEFFPEEGKYHLDGHRKCNVKYEPFQTEAAGEKCPVCGRPLTVGVLNRVGKLSDRHRPVMTRDFFSVIPLAEILSEIMQCGATSRKVTEEYERVITLLGPELDVLLFAPTEQIKETGGPLLAEALSRMRRNEVLKNEGYDGEYGTIRLFGKNELQTIKGQEALFSPAPTSSKQLRKTNMDRAPRALEWKAPQVPREPPQKDPILSPLNPEQMEAVTYNSGHILVTAGPGTGKTLTLTHRIAFLIRSGMAKPSEIIALTFTRKAAKEMQERVASLLASCGLNSVRTSTPSIGTFHSFCLDLIKRNEQEGLATHRASSYQEEVASVLTLCPEWEIQRIARESLSACGQGARSVHAFFRAIADLKRADVLASPAKSTSHQFLAPFRAYQQALSELQMRDYDDLEVDALRLLSYGRKISESQNEYPRWILVDEYQDSNKTQAELIRRLSENYSASVFAIGDPDQAIYGFRGADPDNFAFFSDYFPKAKLVTLKRNYRSTKTIIETAESVLGKRNCLFSESKEDGPIFLAGCNSDSAEAEMVAEEIERLIGGISHFSLDSGRVSVSEDTSSYGFGDIAVLFRLNAMGDALGEALEKASIPFARSGEKPLVSRYPVNLLWAYMLRVQYPENPSYRKVYEETCSREGISEVHLVPGFMPSSGLDSIIDEAVSLHGLEPTEKNSKEALSLLKDYAKDSGGNMKGLLDALSLERGLDHGLLKVDRVSLMSIHSAKGLEWPVVFIVGCEEGLIPCTVFQEINEEEERRLLYVGITRARTRVVLSWSRYRKIAGLKTGNGPSPFLSAIPSRLCERLKTRKALPKPRKPVQMGLFS